MSGLYLYFGKQKQAAGLLQNERPRFEQAGQVPLWEGWVALVHKPSPGAQKSDLSSLHTRLQEAKEAQDIPTLHSLCEIILTEKRSQILLAEICDFLARHNDWAFLAKNADVLINLIGTDAIVNIAVVACANSARYKDVLRILDAHKSKFSRGKLPIYLEKVYCDAQFRTGKIADALNEAEQIVRKTKTLEDSFWLYDMYLRKGDMDNAALVIKRSTRNFNLPPDKSLQLASTFAPYDQKFAKELFYDAVKGEISQENLPHAYFLSIRLGLEFEKGIDSIAKDFLRKANQGVFSDVKKISFDEVKLLLQQQSERIQELEKKYNAGTVPIHIASDATAEQLVRYYHQLPTYNASVNDFRKKVPLLYRYGGLALPEDFPKDAADIQLHMDISSLLLAQHLGILSEVEKVFKPLYIATDVIPCLHSMCGAISSAQPSKLEASSNLLKLINKNKIKVLSNKTTAPDSSIILDWAENFNQNISKSENKICNCRTVADSLLVIGEISNEKYERAIESFGTEGKQIPHTELIQRNSNLLCKDSIAQLLSNAYIIDASCDVFKVYITEEFVIEIHNELLKNKEEQNTISWLKDLLKHISQKLTLEEYVFFSIDEVSQKREISNPAVSALDAFVSIKGDMSTVLWCDDRCINSYNANNGTQVASVVDILLALKYYGIITDSRFFEKMNYLRSINTRFIPLVDEELPFYLENAPIRDGLIQETSRTRITTYVLRCLFLFGATITTTVDS